MAALLSCSCEQPFPSSRRSFRSVIGSIQLAPPTPFTRVLCCLTHSSHGRQPISFTMPRTRGVLLCDPVSDLLTRIRNAQGFRLANVEHPHSRLTASIVSCLIRLGYVQSMEVVPPASPKDPQFNKMRITLKYDTEGTPAIRKIRRVSKPSRRIYRSIAELPLASAGLGSWILTTPKGVLHCAEARRENVGGEILAEIL